MASTINLEKVNELVFKYKGMNGILIQLLQEIQSIFGYLPKEAMQVISKDLDIPISEIYGVITFYSQFTLKPKGKHIIKVCLGTACYVKGAQDILDRLSELLNIKVGETTADGTFTLETARCLGSCGLAPAIMVNEKVYGKLIPDDVVRIIEEYKG